MTRFLIILVPLLLGLCTASGQWQALNGPPGGTVYDIEIHATNGKVYALVNSNNLFVSDNQGSSWSELPSIGITLIRDLLFVGDVLYASNQSYLLKSEDGGMTWVRVGSPGQFLGVAKILKHPLGDYLVGYGSNGIYVGTNAGTSWIRIHDVYTYSAAISPDGDLYFIDSNGIGKHAFPDTGTWGSDGISIVHPSSDNNSAGRIAVSGTDIYAVLRTDVLKSSDAGVSWPSIKTATITETTFFSSSWSLSGDGIYLTTRDNLYFSPDAGATWEQRTYPSASMGAGVTYDVRFISDNVALAATAVDGVFKTSDGGSSWTHSSNGINYPSGKGITMTATGGLILTVSSGKGYWHSADKGTTWSFIQLSANIQKALRLPNDTLVGLGSSLLSPDEGATWVSSGFHLYDVGFNTAFSAGGTYYGASSAGVITSTNAYNWTPMTISGLPGSFVATKIAQDNSGVLWIYLTNYTLSGQREIYRIDGVTEGGTTGTATPVSLPLGELESENPLFINLFVADNKIYIATLGHIYISADQGVTWNTLTISKQVLFPLNKGGVSAICAGTSGSLFISQDDGKTWVATAPSTRTGYINDIAEDANGDYYASGALMPVQRHTGELILDAASLPPFIDFNWQPTNGPSSPFPLKIVADDPNNVYALTGQNQVVYRSGPLLSGWSKTGDGTFRDIAYDQSANLLFAVTMDELLTSADGGDTWNVRNNEGIVGRRFLAKCSNGDWVLVANSASIYISADGGTTFGPAKHDTSPDVILDLLTTASGAIIAYLRSNTSPVTYKAIISTDGGNSWNPITLHNSEELARLSADAAGNIYLAVASEKGSANPVAKSADNGVTWTPISGGLPWSFMTSRVAASTTGDLYVIGSQGVYYPNSLFRSADGGNSWSKVSDLPAGTSMTTNITWLGTKLIISGNQGILISDDDGVTLTPANQGMPLYYSSDLDLVNESELIACSEYGGAFKSLDLNTWGGADPNGLRYLFRNPQGVLMGQSFMHLYTSPDDGDTWTLVSDFPEPFLDVVTANGSIFYGIAQKNLYVSTGLAGWSELLITGIPDNFVYRDLAVDHNGLVYVILFNIDVGVVEAYQIAYGSAIQLVASNPRRIFYREGTIHMFESSGILSYTADGQTWSFKSFPSGSDFMITNNNYYFIPAGSVLWLSRDEGKSWQNVGLATTSGNTPFQQITVNEFNGHAYASLFNSVVHKSAGIVIPAENNAPVVTRLLPAQGATDVSALPTLSITFDEAVTPVAGRKVRVFVPGAATPLEIIDVAAGTQAGKTFSFELANPLSYETSYFVTVDNGAFKDIFGNPFAGIANETTWSFTVEPQPDVTKPTIAYSPVAPAFMKGSAGTIQITITDETDGSGVNPASVKIHYRGITSEASPAAATMTQGTGNTFEVSVPEAWRDELGLEFRFEAADNKGNVQTLPDDGTYFRGYTGHPETSSPTLPSTLLSSGGQIEDYRIFSIPYQLGSSSMNTVFDELSGLTVPTDYRILHYNSELQKYSEAPALSTLARGLGYWINIVEPPSIAIENATTPENSKEELFVLSLKPGWNQIGNPYPFTISWNAVRTASGNTDIGPLKSFNGAGWVEDDKLNPFEGGFVLLGGSAQVDLSIPFSARTTAGRTTDSHPDFDGGWLLPLTVHDTRFQVTGGVGMHPGADLSVDAWDDALPPKLFDIPEIAFAHPEHIVRRVTRDVVPDRDEHVWSFTVHAGEEPAIFRWDIGTVASLEKDVYLLNEDKQELMSMREQDQCTVPARQFSSFRIYVGVPAQDITPSKVVLGKPFPNPVNDRSQVTFTLPENATGSYLVLLDVYDNLGRKVTTLTRGEFTPGFYTAEWTPEPGMLNAALYLYRLTVSDRNSSIVLTQKIITKK